MSRADSFTIPDDKRQALADIVDRVIRERYNNSVTAAAEATGVYYSHLLTLRRTFPDGMSFTVASRALASLGISPNEVFDALGLDETLEPHLRGKWRK